MLVTRLLEEAPAQLLNGLTVNFTTVVPLVRRAVLAHLAWAWDLSIS